MSKQPNPKKLDRLIEAEVTLVSCKSASIKLITRE